jgi:hypothetical protein
MWHGRYLKWHPEPTWSDCRVDVDAVHDDWEGFRVWLRHHDATRGVLIVRFDNPLYYASSDESFRIGPIEPAQPKLEFPHVFWRVAESELVTLFHRQSAGAYTSWDVVHYALAACNQVVDVLSTEPPVTDTPAV